MSRTPLRLAAAAFAASLTLAGCGGMTKSTTDEGGPIKKLTLIVPADPGGGWDQTARAMQKAMQDEKLAASAQVVNVGGAGGTVGLAKLANEKNPNTLMVMGYVMVGAVETNKSTTTLADTTPIARLTEESEIIVVPADSPYDTVTDLLADAEKKGKGVSIAGGSAGGADHILAGQMYKAQGVDPKDLNYIPYSGGGESVAALLGGKVSAGISGVGEYAEQVKAGKLKALAVSGPEPSDVLPDVPTLRDEGVDVELTNWRGVVAPKSITEAQAQRLTDLVTELHDSAAWKKALKKNGWADAFLTGEEFRTFLNDDIKSVRATLREIGLIK
jgi:tripartite-type tricarboxylate transporter receptor subunit TctC